MGKTSRRLGLSFGNELPFAGLFCDPHGYTSKANYRSAEEWREAVRGDRCVAWAVLCDRTTGEVVGTYRREETP